jgi:hypothetical protein
MKITPKPGDYVKLAGITDEQYHSVANVLINSGVGIGEYGNLGYRGFLYFGASAISGKLHHSQGAGIGSFPGRELSLSDLLGDGAPLGSLNGMGQLSINNMEPAWDGVGVPPVGCECEINIGLDESSFVDVKILAATSKYIIVLHESQETPFLISQCKFRPLKSEREIAIEEMINSYKIPVSLDDALLIKRLCEHFYDADYRKIKDAEK